MQNAKLLTISVHLFISVHLWQVANAQSTSAPTLAPVVPEQLEAEVTLQQPGVRLTLLAEHPALVTPTGLDVDPEGNIWLVACHTHFRPQGYAGPAQDEVLKFDASGKKLGVFYQKTEATMQLKCGRDGWIYLAERDRILRVRDKDGDGRGDDEETIVALDTVADYPHNGLSGMAWSPEGELVFSLGENFGKDWTLKDRSGTALSGRGEGGIFRCSEDGKKLRRIARGFWNPFALCVRADGEIFAGENDPGSRPPCRLLHVVEGADYGFQWVYGSSPVHPFVAWNGELRGTLGMVHPCGEGPCAAVEWGNGLLMTSWSDHRVDFYPLHRKGAGFHSERIALVQGGDYFRPVGLAKGPDGSLYLSDWVFSSYALHGRGRLWKLEVEPASWWKRQPEPPTEEANQAKSLREGSAELSREACMALTAIADAVLADAALTALSRMPHSVESVIKLPVKERLTTLVALRRSRMSDGTWPRAFLRDAETEIRFECLRWVADAVLVEFLPDVEALLREANLDFRLFEAALATLNTLKGEPGAGVTQPKMLMDRLIDSKTPDLHRAYILRLLPPETKGLTQAKLMQWVQSREPQLGAEAVRTLVARGEAEPVAKGEDFPLSLRVEAMSGVQDVDWLKAVVESGHPVLKVHAERSLRGLGIGDFIPGDKRPALTETKAWLARLDALPGKADPEEGRRLFFHPRLAQCSSCHRQGGRGKVLGPDLTYIAQQGSREALLQSMLEPQREVAPQFHPSLVKLKDGTEFIGILLRSSSTEVFRDMTGAERSFPETDILSRTELKSSLMPAGLLSMLTDEEIRDLLAFLLEGGKSARP